MSREVIRAAPEDTLAAAIERMVRARVRRLLVEDNGQAIGVLARSDVLRAGPAGANPFSALGLCAGFGMPVREAMSRVVVSVPPDMPIEDAARLMNSRKIGILPVVSGGRTVGVLTRSDLSRAFIAMLGEDEAGLRISFDITDTEDAVAFSVSLAGRHGMRLASVSTFTIDGRRSAVVRLIGVERAGMVDEIWKTGHRVLSVVRRTKDGGP
ncbi:MAG TPA: CBS domain-containing protein [Polyangia bacterium]|nr:CBS domain-containing protein [Polyangia bacterium]